EAAKPFEKTVRSFGNSLGGFNSFLNELSYKPKGSKQSFLFYLPWLNHDFNNAFNLEDAGGPILRGMTMTSCTGASLGYGFVKAKAAEGRPFLQALLEVIGVPREEEIPVSFHTERNDGTCQYTPKAGAE